jgi:hypothetical protein
MRQVAYVTILVKFYNIKFEDINSAFLELFQTCRWKDGLSGLIDDPSVWNPHNTVPLGYT